MPDSETKWSSIQSIEEIDVSRYFEYGEDAVEMFSRWLEFLRKPDVRVLEIGSGTGFFTSILLKINPEMKLTCLEPDDNYVRTLRTRFADQVEVVNGSLGDSHITSDTFAVAISHTMVHNLANPVLAFSQMREAVREGGFVVAFDPLPTYRHYYPFEELEQAAALLHEVKMYWAVEWQKQFGTTETFDPWRRNYPQLFDKAGLTFLSCRAWTSIFTLSDRRFPVSERKRWLRMRYDLVFRSREKTTVTLLKAGRKKEEIDQAFETMLSYLRRLVNATEEELNRTHEQEILHRIITIGQK